MSETCASDSGLDGINFTISPVQQLIRVNDDPTKYSWRAESRLDRTSTRLASRPTQLKSTTQLDSRVGAAGPLVIANDNTAPATSCKAMGAHSEMYPGAPCLANRGIFASRALPDAAETVFTAIGVLVVCMLVLVPVWLLVRYARRRVTDPDKLASPKIHTSQEPLAARASLANSAAVPPTPQLAPTAAHPAQQPLIPHSAHTRKPCKCAGCRRARAFAFGQHFFDGGGGDTHGTAPAGYNARPLSPISEARDDGQDRASDRAPGLQLTRTNARDAAPALSLTPTAKDPPPLLSGRRTVFTEKQYSTIAPGEFLHTLMHSANEDHLVQARHPSPSSPQQSPLFESRPLLVDPHAFAALDPPVVVIASVSPDSTKTLQSSAAAFPLPTGSPISPVWDELPAFSPTLSLARSCSPSPPRNQSLDANVSHDVPGSPLDLGQAIPRNTALSDPWLPDAAWQYSGALYAPVHEGGQDSTTSAFLCASSGLGLSLPQEPRVEKADVTGFVFAIPTPVTVEVDHGQVGSMAKDE
ncbi:hypothetical protein FA95DRAFT_1396614 [Auriscalpium vulgare]|uniref:Uncharacterized protein n=1 Tax=Auriscalpium vulgare TaxID=40419 RepID=A0ACB8RQW9_9AGAM|nr:hypothetical protein FA95DRAFT_1396614 [Auriscalpium vulgare]